MPVDKAWSLPYSGASERCLLGRKGLHRDKHSSFLQTHVNYVHKKLYNVCPRCKCEFFYVTYGDDSIEEVADRIPRFVSQF